uniref:ATP synthase subunit a n=1 Tax=Acetobacterium woodii TaxID=33952 RepID=Q9RMB6_ACEWO|nr:F1FO ATPase a subunit [Acetobacterium woodii DSM 1030]
MEGPKIYGELFGLPITQTLVNTWIIMALILVVCYILTKNMQIKRPGKAQVIAETIVTALDDLVGQTMGKDKMKFAPYMLALIMFLAFSNTAGIYGLRSPTADLNCTVACFDDVFFDAVLWFKIKRTGRLSQGFFEPMPFLFPINVIGEFANPVSLSFRLFGNMLGGGIIMALLYSALAGLIFFPVLIPVPFHFYFDIFSGLLQSFIFTMLTMVFISGAMD